MTYGKRQVPRDISEFEDIIGPHYHSGDYVGSAELLIRFWKRRGKSMRSASLISSGILACAYRGDIRSVSRFVLNPPDGLSHYVYSNYEEFIPFFEGEFLQEYGSLQFFLFKFYRDLDWRFPTDLRKVHRPFDEIMDMAHADLKYSRDWEYAVTHRKRSLMTDVIISFELNQIVSKATRSFRIEKGLSPVGSKWKSEQYLLDSIKTAFPNEVVIGQGSPSWLEGQRFDVWLPEHSLAIEYNGKQHYEPVELFGGQEGFMATEARDALKRKKCLENNTELLELKEGYKFEDVCIWIEAMMREN